MKNRDKIEIQYSIKIIENINNDFVECYQTLMLFQEVYYSPL